MYTYMHIYVYIYTYIFSQPNANRVVQNLESISKNNHLYNRCTRIVIECIICTRLSPRINC